MKHITLASSRLFDASTVNGGAIDGLMFALTNVELLLAVLAIGLLCSRMSSAWAFRSLAAFAVAWVVGGVLGRSGVDLPFSVRAYLVALVVIAIGFVFIERIPKLILFISITLFALTFANSNFVGMPTKDLKYTAAFVMSSSVVTIGSTWVSLALGYIAQSKPRLPNLARAIGAFAAATCAGFILTRALQG
jgi:urease accessory protein